MCHNTILFECVLEMSYMELLEMSIEKENDEWYAFRWSIGTNYIGDLVHSMSDRI